MIRSVAEARAAALSEPKRWNAAVYQGNETPLTDSPNTVVHLFCTVKGANEKMRELVNELQRMGYKKTRYGVSHGLIKLERGDEEMWLGLDKRKR